MAIRPYGLGCPIFQFGGDAETVAFGKFCPYAAKATWKNHIPF